MKWRFFVLSFVLCGLATPLSAFWCADPTSTYFVNNTGGSLCSDSNTGTSQLAPWCTIAKVNAEMALFTAGTNVLFASGGVWHEELDLAGNTSGSNGSPVTFGSYGSGQAIISAADIISSWTTVGAHEYSSAVAAQPNQVYNNSTRLTAAGSLGALATGTFFWSAGTLYVYDNPNLAIMNVSARDFGINIACGANSWISIVGLTVEYARTRGIYVCNGTNDFISGNSILYNFEEGIRFDGVSNSTVTQNQVNYNGRSGIEFFASPGIIIDKNTTHDNVQVGGNFFYGGIKGDPSASGGFIIQYNLSYNNAALPGSQGNLTGAGIWVDTVTGGGTIQFNNANNNALQGISVDATNSVLVLGNVSYNNLDQGIELYADGNSSITGNIVYGNTVYGNAAGGIEMIGPSSGSVAGGCTNNLIANNIATGTVNGLNLLAFFGCENPGTDGSGNTYLYNNFGTAASSFIQWGGSFVSPVFYSSYATWEAASGNCGTTGCSHNVQANPSFVNAGGGNFALQAGDPDINAGITLGIPYRYALVPGSSWPLGVTLNNQNTFPGWNVGAYH